MVLKMYLSRGIYRGYDDSSDVRQTDVFRGAPSRVVVEANGKHEVVGCLKRIDATLSITFRLKSFHFLCTQKVTKNSHTAP